MKFFCLLIMVLSLLLVTGCKKNDDYVMEEIMQDEILYTQAPAFGDFSEAFNKNNVDFILEADFFEFCKEFNITKYKTTDISYYTVVDTGTGLNLVEFGKQGPPYFRGNFDINFSKPENRAFFDTVAVGMTVDEVKAADPDGQYYVNLDRFTTYRMSKDYSLHFFESGEYFCIIYKGNTNEIDEIQKVTI